MKNLKYASLFLGTLIMYSCGSHPAAVIESTGEDTIPVQTEPLKLQNELTPIAVSGQFTTDDEVMLSFKTGGIISSLNIKEGDAVKRGQLLATLNPTEIKAQLEQAKLNAEKTKRDLERTQNLYKDSVATLEQLQDSRTTMLQAEQQEKMAAFNSQYSEIRAPKDGFILRKLANAGQQVTAGTAVLQTNGAKSGQWILRVAISDSQWAGLKINDKAKIQTTALPGQELEGLVCRKSEGVDGVTGTCSADITLMGKKPQAIAAGMFGQAVIYPADHPTSAHGWRIPFEALLDGDGSTGYVFVTNDNKTAHKVKVAVGPIAKNSVIITSGLENSKSLIVSGSAYLTDNSAISVQPSKPAGK